MIETCIGRVHRSRRRWHPETSMWKYRSARTRSVIAYNLLMLQSAVTMIMASWHSGSRYIWTINEILWCRQLKMMRIWRNFHCSWCRVGLATAGQRHCDEQRGLWCGVADLNHSRTSLPLSVQCHALCRELYCFIVLFSCHVLTRSHVLSYTNSNAAHW